MKHRILDVNAQATDEAHYRYDQASREQPKVDVVSMLYVLKTLIADGRHEEAKRRYAEWRASVNGGAR
jgi:hypothetical protein